MKIDILRAKNVTAKTLLLPTNLRLLDNIKLPNGMRPLNNQRALSELLAAFCTSP